MLRLLAVGLTIALAAVFAIVVRQLAQRREGQLNAQQQTLPRAVRCEDCVSGVCAAGLECQCHGVEGRSLERVVDGTLACGVKQAEARLLQTCPQLVAERGSLLTVVALLALRSAHTHRTKHLHELLVGHGGLCDLVAGCLAQLRHILNMLLTDLEGKLGMLHTTRPALADGLAALPQKGNHSRLLQGRRQLAGAATTTGSSSSM
mmetsp:Transcript_7307/g.17791  ORF Transcript_7307/g.17791 Transcript_7307/m.17791 type:complete len:205 (+) Transcript_7307:1176-1790(+)